MFCVHFPAYYCKFIMLFGLRHITYFGNADNQTVLNTTKFPNKGYYLI